MAKVIETFDFKNDLDGNRSSYTFNKQVVKFGDGYEQRISIGINNKRGEWTYQRTAKIAEIERICAFFDRHGSVLPFLYSNPQGQTVKAVADDYQLTCLGADIWRINTTFNQVF